MAAAYIDMVIEDDDRLHIDDRRTKAGAVLVVNAAHTVAFSPSKEAELLALLLARQAIRRPSNVVPLRIDRTREPVSPWVHQSNEGVRS